MLIGQSARNTGVHWNDIFHRFVWYIKNVVRLILLPWMVLPFLIIAYLATEWAAGDLGRNGGMTGLFQSVGLHPHTTYEEFLLITGVGVFLAMAWLLWNASIVLMDAAGRRIQNAGIKEWIARKSVPFRKAFSEFEKSYPRVVLALMIAVVIACVVLLAMLVMSPTPRNQMIVWPPAGPQIVQASPYSSVLLQVPNSPEPKKTKDTIPTIMIPATHTISGKAVVTQTGPHTYQVRMIPCSSSTLS